MGDRLEWDEQYTLGVHGLDRDHRHLFKRVNAVIDGLQHGNRGATLQDALDLLLEDVVEHFDREERELARVDYPDLAAHRADHYLLLRTVLRFKFELKYDRLEADPAAHFLVEWVRKHLVEHDLPFKPYLASS